ncbi:MAG: RDD family protein [Candidatus Nanopelagicales bacterium]
MSDSTYLSESELIDPSALPLASIGMRIWGVILEAILGVVTLGIGWLIWYFVVVGRGLTPARQVLKLRVVDARTRVPVEPGRAFVRGFFVYSLLFGFVFNSLVASLFGFPFFFWVAALFILRQSRQTLWDQLTNTVIGQG